MDMRITNLISNFSMHPGNTESFHKEEDVMR